MVVGVNVAVMIGWSPTGGSVLSHAAELPVYTRTQALTGTAILLALCLIVVVVIALALVATAMTEFGIFTTDQRWCASQIAEFTSPGRIF